MFIKLNVYELIWGKDANLIGREKTTKSMLLNISEIKSVVTDGSETRINLKTGGWPWLDCSNTIEDIHEQMKLIQKIKG